MAGGINKLARVLRQQIKSSANIADQLELGRILNDLSLQTDHFPLPIPKGQYLVARQLTHDTNKPLTTTTDGEHNVKLPDSMYPLRPGDRVLVAWINQGTDPVVIDIVVP